MAKVVGSQSERGEPDILGNAVCTVAYCLNRNQINVRYNGVPVSNEKNDATCEPNELDNGEVLHYLPPPNMCRTSLAKPHIDRSDTRDEHRPQNHHCTTTSLWVLHPPDVGSHPGCVPKPPPSLTSNGFCGLQA